MTVTARYRPGAVRSPFVDREDVLEVFDEYRDRPGEPRLLVLTGVGGIGKSRLLHELRRRMGKASPERPAVPSALLNLQEPAQRSQSSALASLRTQYGQTGIRFDRFDIAYAVWWQRLNPHVTLTPERLPFARASEALVTVLDEVSDVPIFGSALRVTEILARRLRRWRTIRHDPALQELDELPHDQLGDAVTYLFAQELNRHGDYLLCVDAYEALVGGVPRVGKASFTDAWLRDLVSQLDHGLVAVASRESLRWEERDPRWEQRIHEVAVNELPFDSRLELLSALGVAGDEEARTIAHECAGLPFYLHLAREAGATTRGTFARIEERFLYHVEPEMVRLLELLSVARIFDHKVFTQLSAHFGVRSDMIAWETLVGFSFVSAAGPDTLQLHQLMAQAISARLSEPVRQELHAALHEVWRARADATPSMPAWREAAYHIARVDEPPLAMLVQYADQVAALAGKPGVDSLLDDLSDLPRVRQLWRAESALLIGDAGPAADTTQSVPVTLPDDADEVDARLAVAAAHAHRLLGRTDEALLRFGAVWPGHTGPVAVDAGLWYADLQMAQGRFTTAIDIANQVAARCPQERSAIRGDLARLRSLTHRFAFDPDRAAEQLAQARAYYAEAGHVVGLANLATNTAELLALTDPSTAVSAAREAISTQERLRADHELGKAYTALALAQLRLGHMPEAGEAIDEAVAVLDRCGYRSGRARAELIRALWHARAGRRGQARDSAVWAVTELETVAVYPTLVMLASVLLDRIGAPDAAVAAAAARAVSAVEPPQGMAQLRAGIREMVFTTIADGWDPIYATGMATAGVLSGFYHRNVRVGQYLVRVPLAAAERMDLRIWPEPGVLSAVRSHLTGAPELYATSDDPPYQVHEWIDGVLLDQAAPRGARVPARVVTECVELFRRLGTVPLRHLPPLPPDWPHDGDCAGFADRLLTVTRGVQARFAPRYRELWRALGIPADPFAPLTLDRLNSRPFRLLHCDVHRKNIILQPNGERRRDGEALGDSEFRCRFLDWELALYGDPVYELAVHLHKMAYLPDEEEDLCRAWQEACDAEQWPGWQADLRRYREHEQVKSALVDSVRYATLIIAAPQQRDARVQSLASKLTAARRVWKDPSPVDPEAVAAALDAAAHA